MEFRRLHVLAVALTLLLVGGRVAEAQQPALEQFEGTLLIVWGDPDPDLGSVSDVRYSLALPDGRVLRLRLAGQQVLSASDFGRRITVSGRRLAESTTTVSNQSEQVVAVEGIVRSQRQDDSPAQSAVLGTRNVIYLLVKFSDDTAVPHPPSFYTDLTNPLAPPAGASFPATVNGFFAGTSWNQFSWQGDVGGVGGLGAPGGWLTLPHPKSYYAPCGWSSSCANLNALSADAVALGKAQGISFTPYDNINFVLSNDLDCCAWGGAYSLDGKSYGATWEPPWGQETGTYAHEMGHSIGLPHSGWTYYAYDSPWDTMSASTSALALQCGDYFSANNGGVRILSCTEPGDGYIAGHKDVLGWIPGANVVSTDTFTNGTWTIEGGALPLGSAVKLIKICLPGFSCTGSTARYLTVEARVKALGAPSRYDNAIPGDGVIIHDVHRARAPISGTCYFNNQSGWAVPIDATPGDYNSTNCSYSGLTALYNAQWVPGQTYINSFYGISISVVSRSGSTFVVALTSASVQPPAAFDKIGPVNGATVQALPVLLTWEPTAGAAGYAYCYDTTNDGACSQWTSTGTSTSATVSETAAGTIYYWQVRANSSGGTTYANGGAGAFWSFTRADNPPGAFNKSSPANSVTGQATSLILSWGASSGATSYQYCYDTTNDETCDTSWTSTATSRSVIVGSLNPGATYYWQVRAQNTNGATLSNGGWWSFSTQRLLVSVTVTTNPLGRAINVDGTAYVSPRTFSWAAGSQHTLATSTPQLIDGARYTFTAWSDAGASSHIVATPSGSASYVANFATEYRLTTAVSPSDAGSMGANPASADGFYSSGTIVQLIAMPSVGYRFGGWTGDLTGASHPATVTMDAAKSVVAAFSTNLIRNSDFNLGLNDWTAFATPDLSYLDIRVLSSALDLPITNGVLLFYKRPPPAGMANHAGVFQTTGAPLPAVAPLRAQLSLANNSTVPKRITVALADADSSDVATCSFWIAPLSTRHTYEMRMRTAKPWANTSIILYADTAGSDGGFYQVDDVSMQYDSGLSITHTECIDPTAPLSPENRRGSNVPSNGGIGTALVRWTNPGAIGPY